MLLSDDATCLLLMSEKTGVLCLNIIGGTGKQIGEGNKNFTADHLNELIREGYISGTKEGDYHPITPQGHRLIKFLKS